MIRGIAIAKKVRRLRAVCAGDIGIAGVIHGDAEAGVVGHALDGSARLELQAGVELKNFHIGGTGGRNILGADGRIVRRSLPVTNAINETLRDAKFVNFTAHAGQEVAGEVSILQRGQIAAELENVTFVLMQRKIRRAHTG